MEFDFANKDYVVYEGDALQWLRKFDGCSVDCIVTSPPYYQLRDYQMDGQLGLERTPEEYVAKMTEVFREARRVLKDEGTLWLNIGDTYCNSNSQSDGSKRKDKDMIGIPWMLAMSLRDDGWYLRQDIIWAKPNPLPESVCDRCTKSHEYIFLMSKSPKYHFDYEAIEEIATGYDGRKDTMLKGSRKYDNAMIFAGQKPQSMAARGHERWKFKEMDGETQPVRRRRDVWEIPTKSYSGAHFATFPEKLVEPCILAGCPRGGVVLDMFNGAATTGVVALREGRKYVGIELNSEYVELSKQRIDGEFYNSEWLF